MRRATLPVALSLALGLASSLAPAFVGDAHAKPPLAHATGHGAVPGAHAAAPAAHAAPRPAPPLPMLPIVARVRVEAAHDRVVVTEELNFPRGDWQSGGLDLYVAFGAPGTPIAVDARLAAIPIGSIEARADDAGEPVSVEPAVHHTSSTQLLLGRATMAGVVVHVKEAQLRQAYALSDIVALRIRSLLAPPAADAGGVRDVVLRLGAAAGQPLTLGKVQVVSLEPKAWITRAEARLCGPEADPWPLSVALSPKSADAAGASAPTIAPPMAVRHPSDDLCVRWWAHD
jgi:hypothetical protein